jgi:hypothetical protein
MSNSAAIDRKAARLRTALEHRYPNISIHVDFMEAIGSGYKGWRTLFESRDPRVLVKYGLVSALSDFGADGNTELVGCHWYAFSVVDDTKRYRVGHHIEEQAANGGRRDRALSKKMNTRVLRLLKPFIRGTWTAPAVSP